MTHRKEGNSDQPIEIKEHPDKAMLIHKTDQMDMQHCAKLCENCQS
jgi:hypothetical protein